VEVGVKSNQAQGIEGNADALSLSEGMGIEFVRDAKGKPVHGEIIAWRQNGVKMAPLIRACGQIWT
jgi:hypothetical protein